MILASGVVLDQRELVERELVDEILRTGSSDVVFYSAIHPVNLKILSSSELANHH